MPSELRSWVLAQIDSSIVSVNELVPEASTRRFWRVTCEHGNSYMAMLAPPETEKGEMFVRMSRIFRFHDIPVPKVHACDLDLGYILVEDFGSQEYLNVYAEDSTDYAVALALSSLIKIQSVKSSEIPPYTRNRLLDELKIFEDWVCGELLQTHTDILNAIAIPLVDRIDSQPKVVIHRDYHSRNLILTPSRTLGIVDFQDGLVGPLAYDLASLLYDCYYMFSSPKIEQYLRQYQSLAEDADIPKFDGFEPLRDAVHQAAIQRQIKAAGIFVRLWFLQRKRSHLPYVVPVISRVKELAAVTGYHDLSSWLEQEVIPALPDRLQTLH